MGYGGWLTLINLTPFTWTNVGETSVQMDHWSFPDSLGPCKSIDYFSVLLVSNTLIWEPKGHWYRSKSRSTTTFSSIKRTIRAKLASRLAMTHT